MDPETRKTQLGDGRELVFMAIGALLGLVAGFAFTEDPRDRVAAVIIGLVLGQIVNRLLRWRERRSGNRAP